MRLFFFGAGKIGKKALTICEKYYKDNRILFIDNEKMGDIDDVSIVPLQSVGKNEAIVITVYSAIKAREIYLQLYKAGYNNLFLYLMKDNRTEYEGKDFLTDECQRIKNWGYDVLPQVEMHISDWCNMNCRGCTHFSPIFAKSFPNIDERLKDIRVLKGKFSHIIRFYFLGGEPLLNPEIEQYIRNVRNILPETDLWIVTNGVLIPNLGKDVLESIRDNDVTVSISEYEPTHKIIGRITKKLEQYCINYDIRAYERKQKFNLPLSVSPESKREQLCISNGCVNIYNGKISRCPTLMYIDEFNNKFGTSLPNEGIISLDDDIKGEKLFRKLQEDVPLCKHCVKNEINWERCGKEIQLTDFAAEN